jgi:hypothetical protein
MTLLAVSPLDKTDGPTALAGDTATRFPPDRDTAKRFAHLASSALVRHGHAVDAVASRTEQLVHEMPD